MINLQPAPVAYAFEALQPISPDNPANNMRLLSLDDSLNLDNSAANKLFAAHMNKYMLQIFSILGLSDLDIKGAQGIEI